MFIVTEYAALTVRIRIVWMEINDTVYFTI